MKEATADVVIVGGGPAGVMAGLLLARAGVEVVVLEKHGDFLRDFRGDTVHPSTMQLLDELGLLQAFLARPHNRIDRAEIDWNGQVLQIGDLSHLAMPAPFIAMMPQWHFLDFLREYAGRLPTFSLRLSSEVRSVEKDSAGRCSGVVLLDGMKIAARRLVLMCDGRNSIVRRQLPLESLGVPIDVFWFAVPKVGDGSVLRGTVRGRRLIVMIDRGDYWQCACVIAKGTSGEVIAKGIAAFRRELAAAVPSLSNLENALPDFNAVSLLSVSLDRLTRWHDRGLLAIGDAAHAMSPVGGIGINLAIQDAVCVANILAPRLAAGRNADDLLAKVQARRMFPTRVIQAAQAAAHRNLLQPVIAGERVSSRRAPLVIRLMDRFPLLRRIPGQFIGRGIRQEHVRSPAVHRLN